METLIRSNITDHPYALQTWDGPCPFLMPGDGETDLLRIKAPNSYWLYLESCNSDHACLLEILRRDLNGSNGLPPLGESFQLRVRKTLSNLKKTFHETDWRIKAQFKNEHMFLSIKRHDFLPGTSMEFPPFITPPPPYGPRPSLMYLRDHMPNYVDMDDDELEARQRERLFGPYMHQSFGSFENFGLGNVDGLNKSMDGYMNGLFNGSMSGSVAGSFNYDASGLGGSTPCLNNHFSMHHQSIGKRVEPPIQYNPAPEAIPETRIKQEVGAGDYTEFS